MASSYQAKGVCVRHHEEATGKKRRNRTHTKKKGNFICFKPETTRQDPSSPSKRAKEKKRRTNRKKKTRPQSSLKQGKKEKRCGRWPVHVGLFFAEDQGGEETKAKPGSENRKRKTVFVVWERKRRGGSTMVFRREGDTLL